MTDAERGQSSSRRRFLRWAGTVGIVGTAGCGGSDGTGSPVEGDTPSPIETASPIPRPSATPTSIEPDAGDLATRIRYWASFPSEENLWSRFESPYDFRTENRRWLAWPTETGSIRCRVEGDVAPGNAGFYLDVGEIGALDELAIETETVHSDREGAPQLGVALFLDGSEDGEYFRWEDGDGRQSFVGFGDDIEVLGTFRAGGQTSITTDTELNLGPATDGDLVTMENVVAGQIEGISAATSAALYVSVMGSGSHNVEEVKVHDVQVNTAEVFTDLDWPMFCHDRLNTGSTTATTGPQKPVEPLWTFETDGAIRSSPAVVDGTVYIGSDDGTLYALDAKTGDQKWTVETGGPIESSPAVLGHMVFVGSHDNRIYGIDISGQEQWTVETGGRVRSSPTVQTAVPILEGDVVAAGSEDGRMFLINPWTGSVYFAYDTGAPIVVALMLITLAGGRWEATGGNTDGFEFGFFPYWAKQEDSTAAAMNYRWAPIRAASSAPFKPNENIWFLANDDGRLDRWEHPEPFPKPVWTFHAKDKIRSTPVLSAGHVLIGSWDGQLYGIEDETGEQRWAIETDGKLDASAGATGDTVYFGSTDGSVYGADIQSGDVIWTYEIGAEIHSSPAIYEEAVYIGANDGRVYALGAG